MKLNKDAKKILNIDIGYFRKKINKEIYLIKNYPK